MRSLVVSVLAVAAVSAANAAPPTFKAADQWRKDFRQVVYDGGRAMLREEDRPKHARRVADLQQRAEKLFGTDPLAERFASCVKAVSTYASAWQTQTGNFRATNTASANAQTTLAFTAGENFAECRADLDWLEQQAR